MTTKTDFIFKLSKILYLDNFSVFLHNKEILENGLTGYFDEESKEVSVAMRNPLSFEVFVHEYCHYIQWKEKIFWDSCTNYQDFFNWLDDGDLQLTDNQLINSFTDLINLEHDCEKRAIKLLKLNSIEYVDIDFYIRSANLYLWHYNFNKKFRKKPKKPIYLYENLVKIMPNQFFDRDDYLVTDRLCPDIIKEIEKVY